MNSSGNTLNWQLSTANIGDSVLECVISAIARTNFGTVILVAQDGCLIQIDIMEKVKFDGSAAAMPVSTGTKRNTVLRSKIVQSLLGLKFGQVTITVKSGKVIQIERNEKTRWNRLEGLNGDGI